MCSTHQKTESSIEICFEIKKRYIRLLDLKKLLNETLFQVEYQAKNGCKE